MGLRVEDYELQQTDFFDETLWEVRYLIVDEDTGEITDDAQGRGYSTASIAQRALIRGEESTRRDRKKLGNSLRGLAHWFQKNPGLEQHLQEWADRSLKADGTAMDLESFRHCAESFGAEAHYLSWEDRYRAFRS